MLCHAPEARCLPTERHRGWLSLLRRLTTASAIYLIVCLASAAAAAIAMATLFDDAAPMPHAGQAPVASFAAAWRPMR